MSLFSLPGVLAETLLANSPAGILVYEGDTGSCVLANQAIADMVGGSVEALRLQKFRTLASWRQAGLDKLAESTLCDGLPRHHEVTLQTTFGRIVSLDCFISRFDIEGKPHLMCIVSDVTERKRVEQALTVREQELRTLVENIPDLIVRYDTNLRRIYVNPAWEKASGLSAGDVINVRAADIPRVPNPVHAGYVQKLRQVLDTGTPQAIEFPWVSARGVTLLLEYVIVPEYDRHGRIVGALSVGHDLTDRKRAEEALRRLNRELRAISVCNQTLLRATDEQTLLNDICRIVCDEAGYRMAWVGYAEDDDARTVRPMAWAGVVDGYLTTAKMTWADITERGRGPVATAIRTGACVSIQDIAADPRMAPFREAALQHGYRSTIAIPLKDERAKTFGAFLICSAETNVFTPGETRLLEELAGDLAFGIDVLRTRKDRKRAEAEVERLKNTLANIINSMPSMLVGLDRKQIVTQWNRQAEEATGISATEAIGRPITRLLPDFASWITAMGSKIDLWCPSSMEKLLIEKEGHRRFYDLMLYPLITNGAEGAVLRIEDVTERTRIQELMIQTEKMMSVGGLAAGLAHEINNPLGIITQAVQNIERRVSPDLPANRKAAKELGVSLEEIMAYFEKRQILEFIGSIRTASNRAARIVANMLQFSRNAGITLQPASLAGIMDQALELAASDYDLKKKCDFRNIEIARDYEPAMSEVPVVAVEIEQVMLNLLKNAAQAMIVNPPDRKPRITLRLRQEEKYAVLEVEDNGPGMAEEIRRRVFEPFFTTKEPGIGTGLGLAVSYMIVTQNHKGLIEAASISGQGACFRVRLPLSKESIYE